MDVKEATMPNNLTISEMKDALRVQLIRENLDVLNELLDRTRKPTSSIQGLVDLILDGTFDQDIPELYDDYCTGATQEQDSQDENAYMDRQR
jgi:hypothetical protein